MKSLFNFFSIFLLLFFITGCDSLGKMLKKQSQITYSLKPNPVEMIGDSVQFSISGKFTPKLFAKKVTLVLTPYIKSPGTEKALKTITLVGEKATNSGQKISYKTGGTFNYLSEKIPFETIMRNSKIEFRGMGQLKTKEKKFDAVEIGDCALATSLLVKSDEKVIMANDNLTKSTPDNQSTNIYFELNRSNVDANALKTEEMKHINAFILKNLNSPTYEFKGISVSAYASPDGETDKNENLAKDRANSGSLTMMSEFSKNKNKLMQFGKTKDQFKVETTREDWEGFKNLMEKSTLTDKDLILRVLSMYQDPIQRRKEIRNLSKTYDELLKVILPKLRRAEITLNVNKISPSDDKILSLATTNPDSLSVEELLYAGKLAPDFSTKIQIYQSAEKLFASDWRASNNLGCVLLIQNKINEAAEAFKRSEKIANGSQSIIFSNLGIIESKNGNRNAAIELYTKAGNNSETNYNMGIIQIRNGKYSDALTNFGDYKTFNKALAQLLTGASGSVRETIEASNEKETAFSYYLRAIVFARSANNLEAISNLKIAIEKDNALKIYAKDDAEFIKLRTDAGFMGIVN